MSNKSTVTDMSRNLHRLVFAMDKMAEHLLQKHLELTFSQFRMLMAIKNGNITCQAHIATFFGLTPAAISRQIDILTSKKLITVKTNNKNRREHIIQLTDKGTEYTQKAIRLFEEDFNKNYGVLAAHEQNELFALLQKLMSQFCGKENI